MKLILKVIDPNGFEITYPLTDDYVSSMQGIDIDFNKDIVVPKDCSGIKLTDSNGNDVHIDSVHTSAWPQELQVYSTAISDGEYTLTIPKDTISDVDGNIYDEDIVITFQVKLTAASTN